MRSMGFEYAYYPCIWQNLLVSMFKYMHKTGTGANRDLELEFRTFVELSKMCCMRGIDEKGHGDKNPVLAHFTNTV